MKRIILTAAMLLALGSWMSAQDYPGSQSNKDQKQDQPMTQKQDQSNMTTIQGCVAKTDNGYSLTDKSGTKYDLTGETAQLSDHVGHEVQLTGKNAASSTAPTSPTSAGAATTSPQSSFEVSSVKHISETCNAKPPMSEKPPKQ